MRLSIKYSIMCSTINKENIPLKFSHMQINMIQQQLTSATYI